MRKLTLLVLLIVIGLNAIPRHVDATTTEMRFFPLRPSHPTLYTATGVLEHYGVGMKSGNVSIHTTAGQTIDFYLSDVRKINGVTIHCNAAPHDTFSPPPFMCNDWPAGLKVGTTTITVTYWKTTYQGSTINATDQINY